MSEFTNWLGFVEGHQPTTGCSGSPGISAYPHGIAGGAGSSLWPGITNPDHLTWRKHRHMECQQRLIRAGFDPGPVDGIWSPKMDAAIRAFQASVGICIDGAWGSRTEAAMSQVESGVVLAVAQIDSSDIVRILQRCEKEGHAVTVTTTYGETFTGKPSFSDVAVGSRRRWFISQELGSRIVAEETITSAWTTDGWIDARETPNSWVGHRIEWKRDCDPSRCLPPTTGAVMLTEHMTDDRGSFSLNFFRTKIDGTMVRLARLADQLTEWKPADPATALDRSTRQGQEPTCRCSTCKDTGTVAAEDADGDDYGSLCMDCRGGREKPEEWVLTADGLGSDGGARWTARSGDKCCEFSTWCSVAEDEHENQHPRTRAIHARRIEFIDVATVHGELCHEMVAARVLAALNRGEVLP